ncbi:MAG TPA: hypothetical protein VJ696_12290 [Rhodanobacteraceae bacterium]|nr:hypothetical protein [Rhodanobacteraceae bacterium]
MALGWFDTTEVTEFAQSIADEYGRLRKSVALRMDDAGKRTQKFDKLARKIDEFNKSRKLNFYKKAKLVNEIRFGLRARDVPEPEIAAFVNSLLLAPIS